MAGISASRVDQSDLFQRVTPSTVVASCTSQDDIFDVVGAAACVRRSWSYCAHMAWNAACCRSFVVPHGTASGYAWLNFILISDLITGMLQNLITIPRVNASPFLYVWVALDALFFGKYRRRVCYDPKLGIGAPLTPDGIQSIPRCACYLQSREVPPRGCVCLRDEPRRLHPVTEPHL